MTAAAKPPRGRAPAAGRDDWIETFAEGTYPGDEPGDEWTYSAKDLEAIARNFALLSAGPHPIHAVPVTVTHDGTHAYAWVKDCRRRGDLIDTRWRHVEPGLRRAIRGRHLAKVSAEIKKDFTDRDGRVYPGPYLYRVAVIGADVPRVKGLADIPADRFADDHTTRAVRVFKFADPPGVTAMDPITDRAGAVAYLASMGVDQGTLDAMPDSPEVNAGLVALANAWQAEESAEPPDSPSGGEQTGKRTMMADEPCADRKPTKETITRQFADLMNQGRALLRKETDEVRKEIAEAKAAAERQRKATEEREAMERQAAVRMFCDDAAKKGKLSPAENDEGSPLSVRSRLVRLAAEPQPVRRFSENGKDVQKTELQLQQEEIERREARKFSERAIAGPGAEEDAYAKRVKEYWEQRGKKASRN